MPTYSRDNDLHIYYNDIDEIRNRCWRVADISKFQTGGIDYETFAQQLDGVIIRLGYRGYGSSGTLTIDNLFDQHARNLLGSQAVISGKCKLGLYFFSQAIDPYELNEEIQFCKQYLISNFQPDELDKLSKLPFYIDVELANGGNGRADRLTAAVRTALIRQWINNIGSIGYGFEGGVYASESWYKNNPADAATSCFDANTIVRTGGSRWVAKYNSSNTPAIELTGSNFYMGWDMWQYTSSGHTPGYGKNIDMSWVINNIGRWDNPQEKRDLERIDLGFNPQIIDIGIFKIYNTQEHNITFTFIDIYRSDKHGYYKMVEGLDYRITQVDKVNVKGTVTIEGINDYIGSKTFKFSVVEPAVFNSTGTVDVVVLSFEDYTTYDGNPKYPKVSLGIDDGFIPYDVLPTSDYTITYSNNINPGYCKLTIVPSGNGNLTGNGIVLNSLIDKYDISNHTLSYKCLPGKYHRDPSKYDYDNGRPVYPLFDFVPNDLPDDYISNIASAYSNHREAGIATVELTGVLKYKGTIVSHYIISYFDMSKCNIVFNEKYIEYDGKEHKPSYAITNDNPELGVDYSVEYSSNIDAGTAYATFEGFGEYVGSQTKSFTISPRSILNATASLADETTEYIYRGSGITPDVLVYDEGTGKTLVKDVDYELSYANNVNVGTATIIITGKGNYKDITTVNFDINYLDLSECTAKYGDPCHWSLYRIENRGERLRLYATDSYDYLLSEGADYIITDIDMDSFAEFALISIDVTGINNVTGDYTYRFRVIDEIPPEPDYTDDELYNFGDIDLGDETAEGGYTFDDKVFPDGSINPEILPDEVTKDDENYDFDLMSGYYIATYDIDNGKNINENGERDDEVAPKPPHPDDGVYNFEDLDNPEADYNIPNNNDLHADYDFGEIPYDKSVDSIIIDKKDYDFNKFAGDIEDWLQPGVEYELDNTSIYSTYQIPTSFAIRSGTYFIYSSKVKNGRVRVCSSNNLVSKPAAAAGWCKTFDLINLGEIVKGDTVIVTGKIYIHDNGTGGYIMKTGETMWVKEVYNPISVEYNYLLTEGFNGPEIGYAKRENLKLLDLV